MEETEETEYIFVSLEGLDVPATALSGPLTIEGLLTDTPSVTVGNKRYRGQFDEDIGSTLLFDKQTLKRAADAQDRVSRDLTLERTDEEPLVCITSRRLALSRNGPAGV